MSNKDAIKKDAEARFQAIAELDKEDIDPGVVIEAAAKAYDADPVEVQKVLRSNFGKTMMNYAAREAHQDDEDDSDEDDDLWR